MKLSWLYIQFDDVLYWHIIGFITTEAAIVNPNLSRDTREADIWEV